MVDIQRFGTKNKLVGDLPKEIDEQLTWEFSYVSPLDLNAVEYLYYEQVFYAGMTEQVCKKLDFYNIPYKIPGIPKLKNRWKFLWEYRPLQKEAVEALLSHDLGILKAAPGFGKTVCAASIFSQVGKPGFIVTQNKDPFNQAYNTLRNATTISDIGRIGEGKKELGDINVVTIQSLYSELTKNPTGDVGTAWRNASIVIVDELHHSGSYTHLYCLNKLARIERLYGISATPNDREDDRAIFINALFGHIVFDVTHSDAVNNDLLLPIKAYIRTASPMNFGYTTPVEYDGLLAKNRKEKSTYEVRMQYQDVEKRYIVYNRQRSQLAVDFGKAAVKQGKSVALIVSRIEHAKEIQKLWPEITIMHAQTKERKEILEKLRRKEIMAVVTTLFDEAVDVPSLDAVALIAGGKSSIKFLQRMRSLRVDPNNPDKEFGYVFYIRDQADYLTSHSSKCISMLKKLIKEHELNELVDDRG